MSKTSRIVIALIANGIVFSIYIRSRSQYINWFCRFLGRVAVLDYSLFVTIFALYDVFDEMRKNKGKCQKPRLWISRFLSQLTLERAREKL